MKRLLALVAGGLGLRALLRRLPRGAVSHSPAEDLRARLARAKVAEPEPARAEPEPEPAPEPEPEPTPAAEQPAEEQPASVDERRAGVHAQARRAIDDLGAP